MVFHLGTLVHVISGFGESLMLEIFEIVGGHIIPFRVFGRKRYKEANDLSNLIV